MNTCHACLLFLYYVLLYYFVQGIRKYFCGGDAVYLARRADFDGFGAGEGERIGSSAGTASGLARV